MADVGSTPSPYSFNLSASSVFLLAIIAPPTAIAAKKGDLNFRHVTLSTVLYFSVIWYLPAVAHACWWLYVRDNGGVKECAAQALRQAKVLCNKYGGMVKEKMDKAVVYGKEAKEAYAAGTFIQWIKETMHATVQEIKALPSYAHVKPAFDKTEEWVKQCMPPLILEFLGKIYEIIRAKLQPAAIEETREGEWMEDTWEDLLAAIKDDHEGNVEAAKSSRTTGDDTLEDIWGSFLSALRPSHEDVLLAAVSCPFLVDVNNDHGEDISNDESAKSTL